MKMDLKYNFVCFYKIIPNLAVRFVADDDDDECVLFSFSFLFLNNVPRLICKLPGGPDSSRLSLDLSLSRLFDEVHICGPDVKT